MTKKWDAVNLLSHSRHDWLNHLQLIKGNLALNNTEKVNDIINAIVNRATHEANLSNLGARQLTSLLLTINWEGYSYVVDYEVNNEGFKLSKYDNYLVQWFGEFFKTLEEIASSGEENHLTLTFQFLKNEDSCIYVDFSGLVTNVTKLEKLLHNQLEQEIELKDVMVREDEFTFSLRFNEVK
jgi:stage 0 sporulation protein B (sporulation initiation phosphotransferase)